MVQLVRDDVVLRGEDGGDRAGVGRETGLKHHARFHVLECGDALFQLHMYAHGAGDGSYRARTHAVLLHGCERRLAQFGMGGQPQVVIGRQVDHRFAVEARPGGAGRLQDAQALVGAFGAPLCELIVEIGEWMAHRHPA